LVRPTVDVDIAMIVKKLIESLFGIASVLDAAGSKKVATDVRSAVKLVSADPDADAHMALAELRQILSQEKASLAADYVLLLNEAGTDEATFGDVHARLSADKLIGKDEADAVAHRYTGGRKQWPSRKAAVDAIRKKFVERAYQESKMKVVRNYKVG
jgi:hypothetical protein